MDSALPVATTTVALFNASKSFDSHFSRVSQIQCHRRHMLVGRFCSISGYSCLHSPIVLGSTSSASLRTHRAVFPTLWRRLQGVSSSTTPFASGGGSGGLRGESSGGGGDGGSDGGDAKSDLVSGGPEEVSTLSYDMIILDVRGMTCGGCAASVKRILENQPQVSSARVNLTTETAIVCAVSSAKVAPDWQREVGEALAKQLTSCGFASNFRGQDTIEGEVSQ